VEVYEKFSDVFYHRQEDAILPNEIEVYYAPTWLPDGYQADDEQTIDFINACERAFISESEYDIIFKQYTIAGIATRIDTEGAPLKSVTVSGNEGLFSSNKGMQRLQWNDGQYGFSLSGPVPEADLLRMAESLREK